ncbi:MAG: cell division protein FtsL [Treponema sp.]|nr:cell division protein FtsL [Treponema sp.]MBR4463905.1 cell division protein FtsL [Treponema sp.]
MNKLKFRNFKDRFLMILAAALIPLLLFLYVFQAHMYAKLKAEVRSLELKQVELIEKNKELISEISVLSSSDRIEHIAEKELDMHKADTNEIVRVEIKGNAK